MAPRLHRSYYVAGALAVDTELVDDGSGGVNEIARFVAVHDGVMPVPVWAKSVLQDGTAICYQLHADLEGDVRFATDFITGGVIESMTYADDFGRVQFDSTAIYGVTNLLGLPFVWHGGLIDVALFEGDRQYYRAGDRHYDAETASYFQRSGGGLGSRTEDEPTSAGDFLAGSNAYPDASPFKPLHGPTPPMTGLAGFEDPSPLRPAGGGHNGGGFSKDACPPINDGIGGMEYAPQKRGGGNGTPLGGGGGGGGKGGGSRKYRRGSGGHANPGTPAGSRC